MNLGSTNGYNLIFWTLFIVSITKLIIDLFTEGGPCEEAGETFLKKLK